MKSKLIYSLVLLISVSLVFIILVSDVKAGAYAAPRKMEFIGACSVGGSGGADECYYTYNGGDVACSCCDVGYIPQFGYDVCQVGSSQLPPTCTASLRTNKCTNRFFNDGTSCSIVGYLYGIYKFIHSGTENAKWDPDSYSCVTCFNQIEDRIWGDSSGIYVSSVKDGNTNLCEEACGAANELDEEIAWKVKIKNNLVSCSPSTVSPGGTFTMSYTINGIKSGVDAKVCISHTGPETGSDYTRSAGSNTCQWTADFFSIVAATTPGIYTYYVKAKGMTIKNCDEITDWDSTASCTVTVSGCTSDSYCTDPSKPKCRTDTKTCVQCLPKDNDPVTLANPACEPVGGIRPTCVNYQCQPQECTSNADCIGTYPAQRCCLKAYPGPAEAVGTCVNKGTIRSSIWLCDPGVWMKCDANNVGSVQSFDGKTYTCINENGEYEWIESTAQTSKLTIFDLIINFLRSLFKF